MSVCGKFRTPTIRRHMQNSFLAYSEQEVDIGPRHQIDERSIYFLSADSYCCELEGGAIALELTTGTYIGIHAQDLPGLRRRIANWPDSRNGTRSATEPGAPISETLTAALLARGILTTSPTPPPTPIPPMPRAALTTGPVNIRWGAAIAHIPAFAMALLTVSRRHQDRKLASLLRLLSLRQRRIHHRHRATFERVRKLLKAFFWLRIWCYTADRHCLFDSLVLAIFLTKRMVPCTFMIGVATKPFLAHAWVQIDEFVLNDTAEHVQMFTPILAIGDSR